MNGVQVIGTELQQTSLYSVFQAAVATAKKKVKDIMIFDTNKDGQLDASELKSGILEIQKSNSRTINSDRYRGRQRGVVNTEEELAAFNALNENIDYNWVGRRGEHQEKTRLAQIKSNKRDANQSARVILHSLTTEDLDAMMVQAQEKVDAAQLAVENERLRAEAAEKDRIIAEQTAEIARLKAELEAAKESAGNQQTTVTQGAPVVPVASTKVETSVVEAPVAEEAPAAEDAPVAEEPLAVTDATHKEAPAKEATPVVMSAPIKEQEPVVTPVADVEPVVIETPATPETPSVTDKPKVKTYETVKGEVEAKFPTLHGIKDKEQGIAATTKYLHTFTDPKERSYAIAAMVKESADDCPVDEEVLLGSILAVNSPGMEKAVDNLLTEMESPTEIGDQGTLREYAEDNLQDNLFTGYGDKTRALDHLDSLK